MVKLESNILGTRASRDVKKGASVLIRRSYARLRVAGKKILPGRPAIINDELYERCSKLIKKLESEGILTVTFLASSTSPEPDVVAGTVVVTPEVLPVVVEMGVSPVEEPPVEVPVEDPVEVTEAVEAPPESTPKKEKKAKKKKEAADVPEDSSVTD